MESVEKEVGRGWRKCEREVKKELVKALLVKAL